MSDRKYIILKNDDTGKEYAVVFDRDLSHSSVAHGIMREMARNEWGPHMYLEPVSAGFVRSDFVIDPTNGSESLKLSPRPQDQARLNGAQPLSPAALATVQKITEQIAKPKRSRLDRMRGTKARL